MRFAEHPDAPTLAGHHLKSRLPDGHVRRTVAFGTKLTPEEAEAAGRKVTAAGLTRCQWIRKLILEAS